MVVERLHVNMLVSTDGSLGPLVLEESPVKQSVRQDYEITGFIFKKWDFLTKLATISFS
jgi:hypothetical protein